MADIFTQIWMARPVRCAGTECRRLIRHAADGIFVARGAHSVGFCSEKCFLHTTAYAIDQLEGDRACSAQDQLAKLSYRYVPTGEKPRRPLPEK